MNSKDTNQCTNMSAPPKLCLHWNNHSNNLLDTLTNLLASEQHSDVTLACQGQRWQLHRLVLSASSPHLARLLAGIGPGQAPLLIVDGPLARDVAAIVSFVYHGEVSVDQEHLPNLLKTAAALQIKGLAEFPLGSAGLPKSLKSLPLESSPMPTPTVLQANHDVPPRSNLPLQLIQPDGYPTVSYNAKVHSSSKVSNNPMVEAFHSDAFNKCEPMSENHSLRQSLIDGEAEIENIPLNLSCKRGLDQEPDEYVQHPSSTHNFKLANDNGTLQDQNFNKSNVPVRTACNSNEHYDRFLATTEQEKAPPTKFIEQYKHIPNTDVLVPKRTYVRYEGTKELVNSTSHLKVVQPPIVNSPSNSYVPYPQTGIREMTPGKFHLVNHNAILTNNLNHNKIHNISCNNESYSRTPVIKTSPSSGPTLPPACKRLRMTDAVVDKSFKFVAANHSAPIFTNQSSVAVLTSTYDSSNINKDLLVGRNQMINSAPLTPMLHTKPEGNLMVDGRGFVFNVQPAKKFDPIPIKTEQILDSSVISTKHENGGFKAVKEESLTSLVSPKQNLEQNKLVLSSSFISPRSSTLGINLASHVSPVKSSPVSPTVTSTNTSEFSPKQTPQGPLSAINFIQTVYPKELKPMLNKHNDAGRTPSVIVTSEDVDIDGASSSNTWVTTTTPTTSLLAASETAVGQRVSINMRTFKEEWRRQLLVDYDTRTNMSICMLCFTTFKSYDGPRKNTYVKHAKRFHPGLEDYSEKERDMIIDNYEKQYKYDVDMQKEVNKSFRCGAAGHNGPLRRRGLTSTLSGGGSSAGSLPDTDGEDPPHSPDSGGSGEGEEREMGITLSQREGITLEQGQREVVTVFGQREQFGFPQKDETIANHFFHREAINKRESTEIPEKSPESTSACFSAQKSDIKSRNKLYTQSLAAEVSVDSPENMKGVMVGSSEGLRTSISLATVVTSGHINVNPCSSTTNKYTNNTSNPSTSGLSNVGFSINSVMARQNIVETSLLNHNISPVSRPITAVNTKPTHQIINSAINSSNNSPNSSNSNTNTISSGSAICSRTKVNIVANTVDQMSNPSSKASIVVVTDANAVLSAR